MQDIPDNLYIKPCKRHIIIINRMYKGDDSFSITETGNLPEPERKKDDIVSIIENQS